MSPETHYKIEELEELTGLSRRLIYDYISRDLVPPAMGSGKGAYYLQEHYDRLRLISLLRTMGFRLERIEEAVKTWSPEEIARTVEMAEGRDVESLDTLSTFLTSPAPRERRAGHWSAHLSEEAMEELMAAAEVPLEEATPEADALRAAASYRRAPADEVTAEDALDSLLFARMETSAPRAANAEPSPSADADRSASESGQLSSSAGALERFRESVSARQHVAASLEQRKVMSGGPAASPTPSETWHRTRLAPDIEISYRDDIDPDRRRVLEDLIARVKEVFGK